jgi:hypothetical protein
MSAQVIDLLKARDERRAVVKETGAVPEAAIEHTYLRWVYALASISDEALSARSVLPGHIDL